MPQIHRIILPRISRVFLTAAGFVFAASSLIAQVPTNSPHLDNVLSKGTMIPTMHKTVKIVAGATPIPFGTVEGNVSSALLDMKGNGLFFTRKFTFRNTSLFSRTISTVTFEKNDDSFEFVSVGPDESLPIEVSPGQTFSVHVAFHSNFPNDLRTNKVRFMTEESSAPIIYSIQAMQLPVGQMDSNVQIAVEGSK